MRRPWGNANARRSRLARIVLFCAGALSVAAPAGSAPADSERSIALVLDASGSMKARLADGVTRMDAAKAAVAQLVATLPPATRLSFRAYGHQSPTQKKDCQDTALLAPFDTVANGRAEIGEKARALQPLGYTPITYSLTRAAEDLGREEAVSRVVVLVSDGRETCGSDPCAAARALAEADARLVVHIVGVGVDAVTRSQLQCIARNARGSYFDANGAAELAEVVGRAAVKEAGTKTESEKRRIGAAGRESGKLKMEVSGRFAHEIIDAAGRKVAELSWVRRAVDVPPGIYSVRFGNGLWTGIEVKSGETTEIRPGFLKISPMGGDFVYVLEAETGQEMAKIFYTHPGATLIPGRFELKFGKALWPGGVELEPGGTTTIRPGVIKVTSALPAFKFRIRDLDGAELADGDTVNLNAKRTLPPGRYVVEIDPDKWVKTIPDERRTMEVEIGAGEELEITVEGSPVTGPGGAGRATGR